MVPYTRERKRIFEGPFDNTKIDANAMKKSEPVIKRRRPPANTKIDDDDDWEVKVKIEDDDRDDKMKKIDDDQGDSTKKRRRPRFFDKDSLSMYLKQVKESEGFDVDDFSEFMCMDMIVPVKGNIERKRLFKKCCNRAIKYFVQNIDQDAKLKFHKVVKANARGGGIWTYYITFEAKDTAAAADDDQVKTFEAVVDVDYVEGSSIEVDFCRQKLPPQLPSSS